MLGESRAKERDDGFPIESFSSAETEEKTNRAREPACTVLHLGKIIAHVCLC